MTAVTVYGVPGKHEYIAMVDGRWWHWPAERNGWARRQPIAGADGCDELPPRQAWLALRLSGVPDHDH